MSDAPGFRFDGDDSETYERTIGVSISRLPTIRLTSITFRPSASWLERLAVATLKRRFTLADDWQIAFSQIKAPPGLNGVVTIPRKYKGQHVEYDGASVPVPWLVSFLSMGALRPLGVMLIPSIVHDFAFRFGELLVAETPEATPQPVKIERHEADDLFYDMIRTLNGDILTATLAWLAVRLGWPFVRYNGKARGGKAPIRAYLGVIVTLLLVAAVVGLLIDRVGWSDASSLIAIGLAGIYLSIWLGTLLVLKWMGKSDHNSPNDA